MARTCPKQVAGRLATQSAAGSRRLLSVRTPLVLGITGMALTALAVSIPAFSGVRSVGGLADFLRGRTLSIDNRDVWFGEGLPSQELSIVFRLRNISGQRVRVLGCRTTCRA